MKRTMLKLPLHNHRPGLVRRYGSPTHHHTSYSTRPGESLEGATVSYDLGFTFCYVSTLEAKLEVAITAGTFLILIYAKIGLFRNASDFRNLFRDGHSPHCIL